MSASSRLRRIGRAPLVLLFLAILVFVLLLGGHRMTSPTDLPQGVSWTQTFDDEFSGTVLDAKKWNATRFGEEGANEAPYNPDKESGYYNDKAVTVSNGMLHLTMTSVNPWVNINGGYYGYQSGVITTEHKFSFGPGSFVQARLRVPVGAGLWPAFWATPADGSWPPEIDIFEFFDTSKDTRPYLSYLNTKSVWSGPSAYGDMNTDYRGSWHVFGLYWTTDGQLIPYIDGIARPEVSKPADTTEKMFLLFNLAIQKNNALTKPAVYDIDWVKAYATQ